MEIFQVVTRRALRARATPARAKIESRLASLLPARILRAMRAAEIIGQIKALPPVQQAEVAAFLRGLEEGVVREDSGVRCIPEEDARALSQPIFEENAELFRELAQ